MIHKSTNGSRLKDYNLCGAKGGANQRQWIYVTCPECLDLGVRLPNSRKKVLAVIKNLKGKTG